LGYDVGQYIPVLSQSLEDQSQDETDISVQVLTLYVLCFIEQTQVAEPTLRRHFDRLWDQLAPLLAQDLEANIEYILSDQIKYVRIPWQLYLIACSARLAPYRRFATAITQRRLRSILEGIRTRGGLRYPHSGSALSTRTNAILFDVLNVLLDELKYRKLPLRPFEIVDSFRRLLFSRAALIVARILVIVLVAWSVWLWVRPGEPGFVDLAPNFVASILLFFFATQRDKP
jgi:hypothetical protein